MSIFKKVAKGLIALFIIFSAICFLYSNKIVKDLEAALDGNLANLEVDLSKPGNYSTKILYSYPYAEGFEVVLKMSSEDCNEVSMSINELLNTLQYDCFIKNDNEQELLYKHHPNNVKNSLELNILRLAYIVSYELMPGEYEFNLTVYKGYDKFAGKKQTLLIKYMICGVAESIYSLIVFALAIAFLIVAIVIVLVLWKINRKDKLLDKSIEL